MYVEDYEVSQLAEERGKGRMFLGEEDGSTLHICL
jgi:hypothetical protein